jgi:hypothetical protein
MWGAGQSSEKATVMQNGDSFTAQVFVPVWTSQLFVSDWCQPADSPLSATVTPKGESWEVKVQNRTDKKLSNAQIAIEGQIMHLGEIPSNESRTFTVSKTQGTSLRDFVWNYGQQFQNVVQSRQRAFGARQSGQISDLPNSSVAASFLSQMGHQDNNYMNNFICPPGLDMSGVLAHGGAVLFAWAEDFSPVSPLYKINPRRSHQYTMWRLPIAVQ